jgi:cytosine/adenosine deaminase-related metal-dependent hydrolase
VIAMSKLKMDFYTRETGVQFSVTWKDDEEYRRAKAFLTELAGLPVGRDAGKPEFYYFETEEQCRALFRFQRELRGPGPLR